MLNNFVRFRKKLTGNLAEDLLYLLVAAGAFEINIQDHFGNLSLQVI